jgi:hypothetical protein
MLGGVWGRGRKSNGYPLSPPAWLPHGLEGSFPYRNDQFKLKTPLLELIAKYIQCVALVRPHLPSVRSHTWFPSTQGRCAESREG